MSKPWGGVGAWALDSERAEAEELENAAAVPVHSTVLNAGDSNRNFPSLSESLASGGGGKKKKKGTPIPLSEFATGSYVGPGGANRRSPAVPDEMIVLPTGPRERSAEELDRTRIGGGFRSYGGFDRSSSSTQRNDGFGGGGGGGRRGFDDESDRGRPPSRVSDLDLPSRADEVDNWAKAKTSFPTSTEPDRRGRYSSLGGDGARGPSRADEMDDWSRSKMPLASRQSNFASDFRDPAGPSNSDRWGRDSGGDRERPRLVLNPPRRDLSAATPPEIEVIRNRPNPFGAARPREEVLAEKGLDWKKMDSEIENKTSRPTSSQSSRSSNAQSSRPDSPSVQVAEGAPKPRPKVNPFGDAKPREVVLEEKRKDGRKIDSELEHHTIDRSDKSDKTILDEQINHLKDGLKVVDDSTHQGPTERPSSGKDDKWGKPVDDKRRFQGPRDKGSHSGGISDRTRGRW